MPTYKLTLAYDGTDYHGWQRQPAKRTIQGLLEEALAKISRKKIAVIGAGRTDAGAHAQGQVAHFSADLSLGLDELFRALNSLLPFDIRVVSVEEAEPGFQARKMAISKIYQYRIYNSPHLSPFLVRYVLQWETPLDVEKMIEGASLFIREADFSAFSSNRLLHPVRKVIRSEIKKKGDEIIYTVEANGFLRYMVRTMVAALLEIGKGKMKPEKIEELFQHKRRSALIPTAPARGLCLVEVKYSF